MIFLNFPEIYLSRIVQSLCPLTDKGPILFSKVGPRPALPSVGTESVAGATFERGIGIGRRNKEEGQLNPFEI
jgi:hypothetical protein